MRVAWAGGMESERKEERNLAQRELGGTQQNSCTSKLQVGNDDALELYVRSCLVAQHFFGRVHAVTRSAWESYRGASKGVGGVLSIPQEGVEDVSLVGRGSRSLRKALLPLLVTPRDRIRPRRPLLETSRATHCDERPRGSRMRCSRTSRERARRTRLPRRGRPEYDLARKARPQSEAMIVGTGTRQLLQRHRRSTRSLLPN